MIAKEYLKGTLRTLIFKLLSSSSKMYGYEIVKEMRDLTDNQINLTFGALYPILHKMESEEMVKTSTENVGNRLRKYYKLTKKGKKEAWKKIMEFEDYINLMKKVFDLK